MEREKLKRTFKKFEKAFKKFREIVEEKALFDFLNEELIVEVGTKRFEYMYESLWKLLKEYFRTEGIECSTPLRCFKEAFKQGIVDEENEEIVLEMIRKRNEIVHIYDEKIAKDIFNFIKNKKLIKVVEKIHDRMKKGLC